MRVMRVAQRRCAKCAVKCRVSLSPSFLPYFLHDLNVIASRYACVWCCLYAFSNASKYGCCSFAQSRPSLSQPGKFATRSPSLNWPFCGAAGPLAYALMRFCGIMASFARIVPCHLVWVNMSSKNNILRMQLTAQCAPGRGTRLSGSCRCGRWGQTRHPGSTWPIRRCG
jgi:hypothetical protein